MSKQCDRCCYGDHCPYAERAGESCEWFDSLYDIGDDEVERMADAARGEYYDAWLAYIKED